MPERGKVTAQYNHRKTHLFATVSGGPEDGSLYRQVTACGMVAENPRDWNEQEAATDCSTCLRVARAAPRSPSRTGGESETLKRSGGRHHPRSPDASPERVRELAGGIALDGPLDVAEATRQSPFDQGGESAE